MTLHMVMFWVTVALIAVAVFMGIAAQWIESSDIGWKMFKTVMVLLAGAVSLGIASKWLR